MKKGINRLLAAVMVTCLVISVQDLSGQAIELNGFAGYQFGGKAKLYDGELRIDDAMNYGGKVSVALSTTTYAEVTYMRADTKGRFSPYNISNGPSDEYEFSSNYIHVAGLQEAHYGAISPFATLGIGLVVWSPKSSGLNSKTQFSATFGAGVKIWLTEVLGIRLQGSMMMPMIYNGFGFGCGISTGGSSCGSSLYTRITPFQGEFSGGIIIKLSPK